jgi:hypothetical protein
MKDAEPPKAETAVPSRYENFLNRPDWNPNKIRLAGWLSAIKAYHSPAR